MQALPVRAALSREVPSEFTSSRMSFEPEQLPDALAHRQQLGVDVRTRRPEHFSPHLVKLPGPAFLRPLPPKHRDPCTTAAPEQRTAGRSAELRARRRPCPPAAGSARSPLRSSKVYISFSTTSVASPMARAKQLRFFEHGNADLADTRKTHRTALTVALQRVPQVHVCRQRHRACPGLN